MPGAYLWGWDDTNSVWVKCVVNADGKLIINPAGFLENPPTEDEAKKAATSEWSFDHDADPAAHHAKYTNAESRAAIADIFDSAGDITANLDMSHKDIFALRTLYFDGVTTYNSAAKILYQRANEIFIFEGDNPSGNVCDIKIRVYQAVGYVTLASTVDITNDIATHVLVTDAHHAKYTDAEAVAAFGVRDLTITTGTETSRNISAYNMIFLDSGGGDITLEGFAGGTDGQIVFFVNIDGGNNIIVDHWSVNAAAGNKIMCYSAANETLTAGNLGGFAMVYKGSYWFILNPLT